jgi:hypothetical protein
VRTQLERDPAELDEGDIATLERLILERIQVEHGS